MRALAGLWGLISAPLRDRLAKGSEDDLGAPRSLPWRRRVWLGCALIPAGLFAGLSVVSFVRGDAPYGLWQAAVALTLATTIVTQVALYRSGYRAGVVQTLVDVRAETLPLSHMRRPPHPADPLAGLPLPPREDKPL